MSWRIWTFWLTLFPRHLVHPAGVPRRVVHLRLVPARHVSGHHPHRARRGADITRYYCCCYCSCFYRQDCIHIPVTSSDDA